MNDITAIIVSHIIALFVGLGLGSIFMWITTKGIPKIRTFIYRSITTEMSMCWHEAGHVLAYLKYFPYWNHEHAYFSHAKRLDHLVVCDQDKSGFVNFGKRNNDVPSDLNRHLFLGGMIADMLYHHRTHANRWTVWLYYHFKGCADDLNRAKRIGLTSKKELCRWINEQLADIDEYDAQFLEELAERIHKKSLDNLNRKVILSSELQLWAERYYFADIYYAK